MQIQLCEIHNYAIHFDNNSVYDDDEGFAAFQSQLQIQSKWNNTHLFRQQRRLRGKRKTMKLRMARHRTAWHGTHSWAFFSCFLCPDDPSSMNAPSIWWIFRIGISPHIPNNNNQSTTANNANKAYVSRDGKTSIVTRHKCARQIRQSRSTRRGEGIITWTDGCCSVRVNFLGQPLTSIFVPISLTGSSGPERRWALYLFYQKNSFYERHCFMLLAVV